MFAIMFYVENNLLPMQKLGTRVTEQNVDVVQDNEVVILAVKPNIMSSVLRQVAPVASPNQLFVSLAAGVTMANVEKVRH